MIRIAELIADLWTYGALVVAIVWAMLRLTRGAPARVRYVIVIAGYVGAVALVFVVEDSRPRLSVQTGQPRAAVLHSERVPTVAPQIAITWFAVASILLLRDAMGHAALWRTRRRARAASDEMRAALEWPARVPLLVDECEPMTIGLLRPVVVLPPDLKSRSIAMHELSHLRGRDPLVHALLRAATAILWPTPLWALQRWLIREREAAADEMAIANAAESREDYVQALLQFGRRTTLASAIGGSDLLHRAERILDPDRPRFSFVATIAILVSAFAITSIAPADFSIPMRQVPIHIASRPAKRGEGGRRAGEGRRLIERLPLSHYKLDLAPAEEPQVLPRSDHVDIDVHVARDVHVHREDPPPKADDTRIVLRNVFRIKN